MNLPVLIPAYNPTKELLATVHDLLAVGFSNLIIVNDGSRSECKPIFDQLSSMPQCCVLHHAVNLGKGRAIKTALNYFLLACPSAPGIVTADADGQHLANDIHKVAETFSRNPASLVIGGRRFGRDTPFRSRLGNIMTKLVFGLFAGGGIHDTQSGLRCLPRKFIPRLLMLEGERYEYEMNMLLAAKTEHIKIYEEPISAVYVDGNRSSHFRPLLDSMAIYFLLFRFSISSAMASLIDLAIFGIIYGMTRNLYVSVFAGRFTIGPMVNYSLNKSFVFHDKNRIAVSLIKYYSFATVMGITAAMLIDFFMIRLEMNVMFSKVLVETVLFFFSFTIQRDYIFPGKEKA